MSPSTQTHEVQRRTLLRVLEAADGKEVPLWRILRLGIAQYNARIWELRHGVCGPVRDIQNRTVYVGRKRLSWYRLVK